jgi:hypothetical protein
VSDNEVVYAAIMLTPTDTTDTTDTTETTESGAHCWVTIRREHEPALQALLNTVTAGNQFLYTSVSEIHLHGLSDVQRGQLLQGHEDLIYRDKHGAVFVLEELWGEVEEAVAQAAPSATIQHRIAINLSFADRDVINKLRTELSSHASLNYVEIEFGED